MAPHPHTPAPTGSVVVRWNPETCYWEVLTPSGEIVWRGQDLHSANQYALFLRLTCPASRGGTP